MNPTNNTKMKGKKSIKQSDNEKKEYNEGKGLDSVPKLTDVTTRDIYRLLDLYFYKEFHIYKHLYDSYDKFLDEDIRRFLLDGNHVFSDTIQSDIIYRNKFKFENIRYQSPAYDNKVDPIFPADARYKSLTYSVTLLADVTQYLETKKIISRQEPVVLKIAETVKDVQIGYIPLMMRSKYCNLTLHKGSANKECDYDPGGYFIVNGSEKVVISQDRMVENKPLVFLKKDSSSQSYVVQVNSRAYDTHSLPQSLTIKLKKDNVMTIRVPILAEVNVFAVFRALGMQSDKDIINCITYDNSDKYMNNIVRDSLSECKNEKGIKITTREEAYDFLINKIKVIQKVSNTDAETRLEQKKLHLNDLLKNSFLPHISGNLKYKAMYLGYMINRLIRVSLGRLPIDDRDSYLNKRIDLPGDLMFELFRQQWKKMMNECNKLFNSRTTDQNKPYNIIHHIKPNTVEQGLKASLSTGSWIRRKGVAQMLQRLTYLQGISLLRRVDAPSGDASSAKLTSPRQLHPSSVGFLCVVQTPEHAKIGLVKHLNLISSITIMDKAIHDMVNNYVSGIEEMKGLDEVDPNRLKYMYKVFLNGDWVGIIQGIPDEGKPHSPENIPAIKVYNDLKEKKKIGYFNAEMVSIVIDHDEFELKIYCETGRMYRPILRVGYNNEILLRKYHIDNISLNKTHTDKITDWSEFVSRYNDVIEYIDMEEQAYLMIADKVSTVDEMQKKMMDSINYKFTEGTEIVNRYNHNYFHRYTHCEFHPSILFGEIVVNIPFMDSNQGPRNIFQYSQGRQAMGIYATNYRDRLDISYILYHPQKPVVTTRASKYVFTESLPFGENAIVAIASYTGYNQEDSLIFNLRSVQRGMFRSTSLKKYSSSISKNQNTSQDDVFTKPDPDKVVGIRHGSYDKLNMQGFAPEETVVHNGDILLAKLKPIQQDSKSNSDKVFKDDSESYKSHAPGTVFKVYTKILNADSYETRRMLVRSERTPTNGDKFCCYTPDHEVLTSNGWRSIDTISTDDKVACIVDGCLVYENPTETQEYDYDGDMYVVKSDDVDLMVTPNHRMYVGTTDNNYKIERADDCFGKHLFYKKNIENYKFNGELLDDQKISLAEWVDMHTKSDYLDFPDQIWELNSTLCKKVLARITDEDMTIELDTRVADKFQRLCLHAGYSCNVIEKTGSIDNVLCRIVQNSAVQVNNGDEQNDSFVKYSGKVYCCTVSGDGVIYVRRNKIPVWCGNSRHGQKGTCGILLKGSDMCHTKHGLTPDIILNPNAIPSRMTIGQLIECLIGKVAILRREEADGTPFEERNIDAIKKQLGELGYRHDCTEYMYNGMTGEMMNVPIFIGPTYYNRLKHMVQDKVHARARGPRTLLTRQAPEGRSRDGGLRVGEMERDAIAAHGLARFLKEKLMDNSDIYATYVCGKCGLFAQRANRRNNKKFPQDTDIYFCQPCNNFNDIHKVVIPYAFKLMLHELMSMCIAPRIRVSKPTFNHDH
jgi:DNA-directed RNA polymerase II subunit RPB2